MSAPLSADAFVAALRAEGLDVRLVGDWRNHNRNHKGNWGPVHGVIQHHTVSSGSASSVELCRTGYSELPGPLCHGVIDKAGVVHVISVGRSNHAGGGDPNVLAAVIDERYNDRPPIPAVGNATGVDGNARFYGFECVNLGNGRDPWPAAQVDAMVRSSAALCRAHGWTEKSTIAHREWSRDKPDPAGPGMPTMPVFRDKIKERLAHPASWTPTAPTPPTTGTPVAVPNLSALAREEDITLLHGIPYTVYWTGEHTDEGDEHGAGGRTVLDGGKYSATLNISLSGLGENEVVQIRPLDGTAEGDPHQIIGYGNPALPLQHTVTINGRVYGQLAFQLTNMDHSEVTLTRITLSMLSWPA